MKRKPLGILAAATLAAFCLSGCSQISSGVVHGKQYSPGYMSTCGKGCIIFVPPSWELDLYQTKDDHGWRDVDQTEFDKCSVGAKYPECAEER